MLVKKISLGLAQADKNYGYGSKQKDQFFELINFALENGVTRLDTAPNYKNSDSFISKLDTKNLKVSSKIPITEIKISKLSSFMDHTLDNIFKKNKIDKLENLLFYDPLIPLEKKRWNIYLKKITQYKKNKLIKNVGFSVYNRFEVKNILQEFKPDILQFPYNVFDQSFNNYHYLKQLKKDKILLQARSIFLQGLLCNRNFYNGFDIWNNEFKKWDDFLKRNKIKDSIACANFAFQNKILDNFVFGFRNIKEFKQLIAALSNYKSKNIDYSNLASNDRYLLDPRLWSNLKNKEFKSNYKEYMLNKRKILFGGMLLSKRTDQFIPGKWPNFFDKAYGCKISDKKKNFLDFSLMGVGTNILGYANKNVNYRVKQIIDKSNVSTINSNYHLRLSEKLIDLNKWSSKCFFAKTGGEANSIALRISRCYNKKNKVAICGYHGWNDWYLSANLKKNNNLDHVLLSGLETLGIPLELKNLVHPFFYNDLESLKKIIKNEKNIGTIFMEVQRNIPPKKNFLKNIRKIADQNNIVLIFDECSSGFRENFGGIYEKYGVNPDIVVYGKAIANGYPITAILGKDKIMKSAENSFISSTFWTDNLGAVAAIETLKEMKKLKSWSKIKKIGKKIKSFWSYISKKYKLDIEISGLDAMPSFNFKSKKNDYYKTFITQEMLKKNILTSNTVYCCIDHNKFLKTYFKELEILFKKIRLFEDQGNILNHIDSPIIKKGFERLN